MAGIFLYCVCIKSLCLSSGNLAQGYFKYAAAAGMQFGPKLMQHMDFCVLKLFPVHFASWFF